MILRTLIKETAQGECGHISLVKQLFTGEVGTGVRSAPPSVLSIHLIEQRCGVSGQRHGRALDHGARRGPRRHPLRLLPTFCFLLFEPLLRHFAPVHGCRAAARLWLLLWSAPPGGGGGGRRAGGMSVVTAVVSVVAVVRHVTSVVVGGLRRGAGVLRGAHDLLLTGRGVRVAGRHHRRRHGLLRRRKYVVGGRAASSPGAASVAVLTGAPLSRRRVRILGLARNRGDGVEHLGRHVARESVHSSRQVCDVDIGRSSVQRSRSPGSAAVTRCDAWHWLLVVVLEPSEKPVH